MRKAFTLIELIVVVAIIAVLSAIIMFAVKQYISMGKDSNISASLATLVPAGEYWYNAEGSYADFCDPEKSSIVKNAIAQMPDAASPDPDINSCYSEAVDPSGNPAGLCCFVNLASDAWVACAQKFSDAESAYCADSRGVKSEITFQQCQNLTTESEKKCPDFQ